MGKQGELGSPVTPGFVVPVVPLASVVPVVKSGVVPVPGPPVVGVTFGVKTQ